jgi:hypothetical protein
MTVPAGGAVAVGVSYAMFSSWGFGPAAIASSTLGTFVIGMSVKLLLPALALAALALEGERVTGAMSALTGAIVLGAGGRWRHSCFGTSGPPANRPHPRESRTASAGGSQPPVAGLDDRAVGFRRSCGLLRDRWATLSVASVVSQLSVFLVMLVACIVGISRPR